MINPRNRFLALGLCVTACAGMIAFAGGCGSAREISNGFDLRVSVSGSVCKRIRAELNVYRARP